MKIEKLNDNQIRCTLNKADLEDRNLVLNELAYGSEKAKELFRDMMEQAHDEFGFEVNDIPLMIEAVPVNPDCLILIITKVEDPEELDTRFSRFSRYSQMLNDNDSENDEDSNLLEQDAPKDSADVVSAGLNLTEELIDKVSDYIKSIDDIQKSQGIAADSGNFYPLSSLLKKNADFKESINEVRKKLDESNAPKKKESISPLGYSFNFNNMQDVFDYAPIIVDLFDDDSSLFKHPTKKIYRLVVHDNEEALDNGTLLALTRDRSCTKMGVGEESYMFEHFKVLISHTALRDLTNISSK